MCACYGDVGLSVGRVLISKGSEPFEDAIALGRVTSRYIQHQVYESVVWIVDIANDEGARVEPLSQTGAELAKIRVTSELNLDDRARDISLANSYSVEFKRRPKINTRSEVRAIGKKKGKNMSLRDRPQGGEAVSAKVTYKYSSPVEARTLDAKKFFASSILSKSIPSSCSKLGVKSLEF